MIERETLVVEFQGASVEVLAPPAIAEPFRRGFSHMLTKPPPPGQVVGQIAVDHEGATYRVSGDTEIELEDGSVNDVVRCLRFSVVQLLIQAFPKLLWFHAGVASRNGSAVLFPGRRGRGKSTIVSRLCLNGWRYLSDDIAPIIPETGTCLPFPVTPARRDHPGRIMPDRWLLETQKREVTLPRDAFATCATRVSSVVFLEPTADVVANLYAYPAAAATVELLHSSWNYSDHAGGVGIESMTRLAGKTSAFRLQYSDPDAAATLLQRPFTEWGGAG